MPSMFVTVALGSGIEQVIDQNTELNISNVILSPEIYIPIIGFFIILTIAFIIKKFYFNIKFVYNNILTNLITREKKIKTIIETEREINREIVLVITFLLLGKL